MRITHIREGFANNSSSSHSLIYTKKRLQDDNISGEYDWNWFQLQSPAAKMEYCVAQVISNIPTIDKLNQPERDPAFSYDFEAYRSREAVLTNYLIENFFKKNFPQFNFSDDYSEYSVDHQSVWNLPVENSNGVFCFNEDFLKDLILEVVYHPDITIFGGNDNDGPNFREMMPDITDYKFFFSNFMQFNDTTRRIKARWDKNNKSWVLYSVSDGLKITVQFEYGENR